jgi:oligopeptide/dipeptide ABC transporter ATP-binding protein
MSVLPQATPATGQTSDAPLLEVRDLQKHFVLRGGWFSRKRQYVRAVDGVSFKIARGRTLGLVGESGCGKTTVGRAILQLTRIDGGEIRFDGRDVLRLPAAERQTLRCRMQIIFQDPYGSLNPRMTVGTIIAEPLVVSRRFKRRQIRQRVDELLAQVGLDIDAADRYPHEFSGGQRQRIGIARAVALKPEFIVCDEPTSALDVSIRAQVINLLENLQEKQGITYLMISHDLGVVRHVSHDVAVMYLGRIVEQAPTDRLFEDPRHPYTRMLLDAIPSPDPERRTRKRAMVDEEIPSPIQIPSGCPFHPRCPLYAAKGKPEVCRRETPPAIPIDGDPHHGAACHFANE